MGKWIFVYSEIWAAAFWGQSQQEQLSVMGLDTRTNKRCLDYLVGQLCWDLLRSQRKDMWPVKETPAWAHSRTKRTGCCPVGRMPSVPWCLYDDPINFPWDENMFRNQTSPASVRPGQNVQHPKLEMDPSGMLPQRLADCEMFEVLVEHEFFCCRWGVRASLGNLKQEEERRQRRRFRRPCFPDSICIQRKQMESWLE